MEREDTARTGVSLDDELAALVAESTKLQEKEMMQDSDGIQPDYILLAKSGTKALKRTEKELFIENLHDGDFFLQKEKLVLGERIHVVPLMFIKVYNEMDGVGKDAKFLGKWTSEQALAYPLAQGSYFDRQLPNGHILTPVNWVVVHVKEAPELNFPVIAYKRTGNRIWKAWKEDVRKRSGSSATLQYVLQAEAQANEDYDWTDIGFAYECNLLESDKQTALTALRKSNDMRKAYDSGLLIGKHPAVTAPAERAALPGKSANVLAKEAAVEVEDSFDEEELGF